MSRKSRLRRLLWRWVAPVVGLAGLGLAAFFYFHAPREHVYHLRATAGNFLDTRHRLAALLGRELAQHHIFLDLTETAGSQEALDQVNDGRLDVAFVQGALVSEDRPNVRQVATLQIEPLHLLVKNEIYADVQAHLRGLDSKSVNVGAPGSGTNTLATEVLNFIGLHPRVPGSKGGYVPTTLNAQKLMAAKDRDTLPDAVFVVSSLPSELARHLVTERDYRLVPIDFGEAFALDAVAGAALAPADGTHIARVAKGRVSSTAIPAFTYSVEPPVPAAPLPSLGTHLLLVARRDADPHCMSRIVEVIFGSDFARTVRPPLDPKAMELAPEFPWHAGTERYQVRNAPLLSGTLMDALQKSFAIFAAAASGLFVLWQWTKQRSQFMRDNGFINYIGQVTRLEEQAILAERNGEANFELLLGLRHQLLELKTEALDRFTEGELQGKELMLGFLAQVNDVRDYLSRLMAQHQLR